MELNADKIRRIQVILKDTVEVVCKNELGDIGFSFDAMIRVRPDCGDAFVLKFEDRVERAGADAEGERGDGASSSRKRPPDGAARRKRSKRHRSDDDGYDDASDDANDSDHDADEGNDSCDGYRSDVVSYDEADDRDDTTPDDTAPDVSNVDGGSHHVSSSLNQLPANDDAGASGSRQVRDLLLLVAFLP